MKRPFRIWEPRQRVWLRGRCYVTKDAAVDRGVVLTFREKVGVVHEVIDIRGHRWVAGFRRSVNGVLLQEPAELRSGKDRHIGALRLVQGGKHGSAA